jgi:hypothetical protein
MHAHEFLYYFILPNYILVLNNHFLLFVLDQETRDRSSRRYSRLHRIPHDYLSSALTCSVVVSSLEKSYMFVLNRVCVVKGVKEKVYGVISSACVLIYK